MVLEGGSEDVYRGYRPERRFFYFPLTHSEMKDDSYNITFFSSDINYSHFQKQIHVSDLKDVTVQILQHPPGDFD